MLVLSRKLNESIVIDGHIRITVVGLRGNHVRIGIEAPNSVRVMREELYDRGGVMEISAKRAPDALATPGAVQ